MLLTHEMTVLYRRQGARPLGSNKTIFTNEALPRQPGPSFVVCTLMNGAISAFERGHNYTKVPSAACGTQ